MQLPTNPMPCACWVLQATHEAWVSKFFQWVGFNLALAFAASLSLFIISPAASGSGIPGNVLVLAALLAAATAAACAAASMSAPTACQPGSTPAQAHVRHKPGAAAADQPAHLPLPTPTPLHAADVQAYLNGVESPAFKNFFTVKTFVAKVIGSSLAVGSSLVMVSVLPVRMLHG